MSEPDGAEGAGGRRGGRLSWRTWVFVALALGWAVVAVVSSRDRAPACGFAVLAAVFAVGNVNRDRRRNVEPPSP